MPRQRVNIREIAKLANVSVAAVSYAMHGDPRSKLSEAEGDSGHLRASALSSERKRPPGVPEKIRDDRLFFPAAGRECLPDLRGSEFQLQPDRRAE